MLRFQNLIPAFALIVLVSACSSTPTAVVDHNPEFDFSGVQRVAILPLNRDVTPQTAISDMQAVRMNSSLAGAMTARGLTVVDDPANADLLLTWHLVTQERTDVRTYNAASARYTRCWSCAPTNSPSVTVRQYTRGTLIADLIDPSAGLSVWRSVVESRLPSNMNQDNVAELRDTATAALFVEFPP